MDAVKKSLISLHFTVILLGGTALFSRLVPLSASDITLVRSVFACIALFAFLKLAKNKIKLNSKKDYGVALGLGVLMACIVTYFAAMQYAGVFVTSFLPFCITVLIEPFFDRLVGRISDHHGSRWRLFNSARDITEIHYPWRSHQYCLRHLVFV